jgi:peptidase E
MAEEIYLLGGGNQSFFLENDKKLIERTKNKKVFVINLTTNDEEKLKSRLKELENHFKNAKASEVIFASNFNSVEKMKKELSNSGILFISGGDTEILLDNLKRMKLDSEIKSFKGIIEGNSAGAYACCKKYIKIKEGKIEIVRSLGIIDLICKAHYTNEVDSFLLNLSKEEDIYCLPENSIIIYKNGKLNFVGDVYLFSKGEKIKLN